MTSIATLLALYAADPSSSLRTLIAIKTLLNA